MIKKVVITIICFSFIFGFLPFAQAGQTKVDAYFFHSVTCSYCVKEADYLVKLKKELPYLQIHSFELSRKREYGQLLADVAKELNFRISGIPVLFIGEQKFVGFGGEMTTGQSIKETVVGCYVNGCRDVVGPFVYERTSGEQAEILHVNEDEDDPSTLRQAQGSGSGEDEEEIAEVAEVTPVSTKDEPASIEEVVGEEEGVVQGVELEEGLESDELAMAVADLEVIEKTEESMPGFEGSGVDLSMDVVPADEIALEPVIEVEAAGSTVSEDEISEKIDLPFFGEVEVKSLSLPVLTIAIAALDGFNPCAMWVLLFLISLLLGMKNRKRMWILGSTFIVASGAVYFLFLSAWLKVILFYGMVIWLRIAIAAVAIASGIYHIREFWLNRSGCKVTNDKKRQKIFAKLRAVTQRQEFWLALGGIILLAAAVNLVELVCSAGLPAVYTSVLGMSNLPGWQYYLYLILYIVVFMLDDLIVFFIAMTALRMVGISSKYSRWSNLIGGIIILIIGVLLVLRPEWLTFH